ncbi:hypothetical protein [Streptomyces hokutonensis]|uniref:hypothetical protein n=1 Tax=Streptomyces hokutonensis TaxID=1306990 RepID=UPI0038108674
MTFRTVPQGETHPSARHGGQTTHAEHNRPRRKSTHTIPGVLVARQAPHRGIDRGPVPAADGRAFDVSDPVSDTPYAQADYSTGGQDHETYRWNVHDDRSRDFWGNAVIESWYKEATAVRDPDSRPQPVSDALLHEAARHVGADGLG